MCSPSATDQLPTGGDADVRRFSSQVHGTRADQPAVVAEVTSSQGGADDLTAAVHAARNGDEDAFRSVYRSVQPGLLRYLRVLVGSDAEDVASEAWLQIARDLGSFSGDGDGFRGWAATIARHRAVDHQRRLRRRPVTTVVETELTEPVAAEDTAGLAIQAMSTDAAIALITALPRDQAEAVLLRVVMGLSAETAGRVLGKRSGAVRTAAYRGLRRLAGHLDEMRREGGDHERSPSPPSPEGPTSATAQAGPTAPKSGPTGARAGPASPRAGPTNPRAGPAGPRAGPTGP